MSSTRLGDELLAKYNPYHDSSGRFSSSDGASFVSTTNRTAVATMRANAAAGIPVGIQPAAGPMTPAEISAMAEKIESEAKSPLMGSDKQVSWAQDIRSGAFGRFTTTPSGVTYRSGTLNGYDLKARTLIAEKPGTPQAEKAQGVQRAIASLRAEPSAKFWIDNRNTDAVKLIGDRMK